MKTVGAEILVKGLVQGVGYRYFCYNRARNLGLTGWVKNNPDGSVSLMVEGDRSLIESLLDELKVGPRYAVVKDVRVTWFPYSGKYTDFQVTF